MLNLSGTPEIAVNRFGLGAAPGELARVGGDGREALRAQLTAAAPVLGAQTLEASPAIVVAAAALRAQIRAERERGASDAAVPAATATAAVLKLPRLYRPIYVAEVTTRLRHVATTDRPFVERLTHFWSNHFAVSVDKIAVLGLAGSFEREAIRPHVLGRFEDLVLAVERHPAMLLYLDNQRSAGPNSDAARRVARRRPDQPLGLNENLAREILELHTLGVDGGYTQTDVTTFAKVITGWSIGGGPGRLASGTPGEFAFRAEMHEPGPKTILGKSYPDGGEAQGIAVLRDLVHRPETARHVATKLVRHFIADDPPASAVERLVAAWIRTEGDLPSVYRALLDCPEAWTVAQPKFRTPADYVHAAYRALELPVDDTARALAPYELLGQRTFAPGSPAGWPDRSADWDGASAVLKRVEWADAVGQRIGSARDAAELAPALFGSQLSSTTRVAVARAASAAQALTLLLASPEFMRR
jgi:uncharacterized protein (DUF1800 family)